LGEDLYEAVISTPSLVQPAGTSVVGNQVKPGIHIPTRVLFDTSFEKSNRIETSQGRCHIGRDSRRDRSMSWSCRNVFIRRSGWARVVLGRDCIRLGSGIGRLLIFIFILVLILILIIGSFNYEAT
jgi:hypothetical protein